MTIVLGKRAKIQSLRKNINRTEVNWLRLKYHTPLGKIKCPCVIYSS